MSNFERSIVSIIDPKIKVDNISMEDAESPKAKENTSRSVPKNITPKTSARMGAYMPLLVIKENRFDVSEIISMSFSLEGKLPMLSVSVVDYSGKFHINAPHDGDVISLYIRPPDEDNQRPIRIDFDLLSINSDPSSKMYGIEGIMKIPGFFAERCKSFELSSFFNHIQLLCEDLGLGFASNETSTEDSMIRLVPFESYETFLDTEIKSTYKNDDSFFTWYVDPFYYLCLVNINKQFSLEGDSEEVNISTTAPVDGIVGSDSAKSSFKGKLILTNRAEKAGTNVYIENWSLVNNSASVWMRNGYKKYTQYLDIDNSNEIEYVSSFVDPLITESSQKDFILMKGRANDNFYETQNTYKWLGKQAISNVHDNYIFSKILNFQNLEEINKMSLNIELSGMNFYIYKYMRIQIAIYETSGTSPTNIKQLVRRDIELGEGDKYKNDSTASLRKESNPSIENVGNDGRDQLRNDYISGYYLVNSIKYHYTPPGPIRMKLNLIRREWPIPARNKNT